MRFSVYLQAYFTIIFVVTVMVFPVYAQEDAHLSRRLSPITKRDALFKRYSVFTDTYPKESSYFLMSPHGYDPALEYPLVVELHGISDRAYATEALSSQGFRHKYPVFVMVPIAPKIAFWATPQNKAYQMQRNVPYPDHMPFVIKGIEQVREKYSIDKERIYIVGHSMGGSGVMAAMQSYPNIFAGGIASSGAWPPADLGGIKSPLLVFHGEDDRQVPVNFALKIKKAAEKNDLPIKVYTLKNRGHNIGELTYSNTKVWDALF